MPKKKKSKQILTSKHSISHLNTEKKSALNKFISDYGNAVRFYVNYLFTNEIKYPDKKGNIKVLSIKDDLLDCPGFFNITDVPYTSTLTERALSSAATQACGIISKVCHKRKKYLYILSKIRESKIGLSKEGRRERSILSKLNKTPVKFPDLSNITPEISSKVCKISENNTTNFDEVFILSSFTNEVRGKKIVIPFNYNKHSNKLSTKGERMGSFQIDNNYLYIRWNMKIPEKKTEGQIVGLDQGITTCLTLSDGQTSDKLNGHDLDTITDRLVRKKVGSKAFHKALNLRDNYIGYCVNKVNFDNIKELRVEKISNFRYKTKVIKKFNYFGETIIANRLYRRATRSGVQFVEQSSAYRSQRCSKCGYVCKLNRKGKKFCCRHCSFQADADFNASLNHKANLPPIEYGLHRLDNKKGFFWKEDGLFDLVGQKLGVSVTKKLN